MFQKQEGKEPLLLRSKEPTYPNQPELRQIENAKQKVRLNSNQPESDSAIGQHLLESYQCARNYSDSRFKVLTTACSQFHLSLLESVYISRKKLVLCR